MGERVDKVGGEKRGIGGGAGMLQERRHQHHKKRSKVGI
jgi:hypothetical protein